MYNPKLDPDEDLSVKYKSVLKQPMDVRKRKLLSEIFELNRKIRVIKLEIQETINFYRMEELIKQKKDLQFRILDIWDEVNNFNKLM